MAKKNDNPDFVQAERPDLTGTFELHPMYTVLFTGVGSFGKGDTVMAGDLGSAADVQRLVELGAIAPTQSAEGAQAQAEAAQEGAANAPAPILQAGVPYVDPAGAPDTGDPLSTPTADSQAAQNAPIDPTASV